MVPVPLVLQAVPESAVLQTKVPERACRVRSQLRGVCRDPWGDEVDGYLGRRVGDGDKYGHQDVYQQVSRHHARQEAHTQQAPVAFAAPPHHPARTTHTCNREHIRREEMRFSTDFLP